MFKPFAPVAAIAAIAALLTGTSAFAADVSIKYLGKDITAPVLTSAMTTNYATGALNYDNLASGSFVAFCIEPEQPNALSSKGYRTYTVDGFTGAQATLLQGLYSSSFSSVSGVNQQAAFQLAIWEIVRESGSTLSLDQGNGSFFLKTDASSGMQLLAANTVQGLANTYLAAAQSYDGAALYSLTKLTNASYQDLVIASQVTAVPEPETYALLLAGLGAIGLVGCRRLPR